MLQYSIGKFACIIEDSSLFDGFNHWLDHNKDQSEKTSINMLASISRDQHSNTLSLLKVIVVAINNCSENKGLNNAL